MRTDVRAISWLTAHKALYLNLCYNYFHACLKLDFSAERRSDVNNMEHERIEINSMKTALLVAFPLLKYLYLWLIHMVICICGLNA